MERKPPFAWLRDRISEVAEALHPDNWGTFAGFFWLFAVMAVITGVFFGLIGLLHALGG